SCEHGGRNYRRSYGKHQGRSDSERGNRHLRKRGKHTDSAAYGLRRRRERGRHRELQGVVGCFHRFDRRTSGRWKHGPTSSFAGSSPGQSLKVLIVGGSEEIRNEIELFLAGIASETVECSDRSGNRLAKAPPQCSFLVQQGAPTLRPFRRRSYQARLNFSTIC